MTLGVDERTIVDDGWATVFVASYMMKFGLSKINRIITFLANTVVTLKYCELLSMVERPLLGFLPEPGIFF